MWIPDFQKLDKWEDTVKFAVSVRVLRLKMNSKLKKKKLNIYILNDRYINICITCLETFLEWSKTYRNFKIIWNLFLGMTCLNHLDDWLGIVVFQYSSIDVFLSKPILNTMARICFNSLTLNGFQDFILECLLAVAALALIILLA